MRYICAYCNAIFDDQAQCKKHEDQCRERYRYRAYVLEGLQNVKDVSDTQGIKLYIEVPIKGKDDKVDVQRFKMDGFKYTGNGDGIVITTSAYEEKSDGNGKKSK